MPRPPSVRRLALVSALLCLSASAARGAGGAEGEGVGGATASVRKFVDRRELAGAVVLVKHRGEVVAFEAMGEADDGRPMTRDTIFRIASMTKPVTSVAVMKLVEEGKIGLDDPVSKFIPEFRAMNVLVPGAKGAAVRFTLEKAERPITIRHLLTHTSGLTYGMSDRPLVGEIYTDFRVSDGLVETPGTTGDNAVRLASLPLLAQPGKKWEYGLNTDVLGRVVEVASGRTLGTYFREAIFEPLKMDDTSFVVPKGKRSRLAALYVPGDGKKVRRVGNEPVIDGRAVYSATYSAADDSKYESGGAGLCSTASDYGRFLQMLRNRGELDGKRILKAETVDAMTRDQIGDLRCDFAIHGDGFGYGFGVVTGRENPPSPATKGSYSWGGFFDTFFWVDPKEELIGIVMTQLHPGGHLPLWKEFQEGVYRDLKAR